MHNFSLSTLCLLSLVYVACCNPRLPENSHNTESNSSPIGEIELDQIEPIIQMQPSEDQEKRDWNKLAGVWGKRGWNNLSNVWGKRGWNNLSNMWGKRENNEMPPYWGKRGWNNLSNVWGKRGWNNLSNVWGKRGWNKLSNVWGKRSLDILSNIPDKKNNKDDGGKRTSNWNDLKGLWGKRDVEWNFPTVWDRIPSDNEAVQAVYIPDQM